MTETTTFAPVGRCIYCGGSADEMGPLTREHIIAKGLGGTLVLPDASCDKCQEATSKVELYVLRYLLEAKRAVMGIKSNRHKNKQPPRFTVRDISDNSEIVVALPPNVPVAVFREPGIMINLKPSGETVVYALGMMISPQPRDPAIRGKKVSVISPLQHNVLFRMFAKIAHGYAVAKLGMQGFKPLLCDVIRSDSRIEPHFVGGFGSAPGPECGTPQGLHELILDTIIINGKPHIRVLIRLFAPTKFPIHQVIVGEAN
jgi:hypothetical protein